MFSFRNIDSFEARRFEQMGMLKGKRWYKDLQTEKLGLFKPKRYEYGDKKVFCANHYGEFIGYVLGKNANIPVCDVELAHLSKYYSSIHKLKYGGTPIEKDGCITYSTLKKDEELEHGKSIIEAFEYQEPKHFEELTKNDTRKSFFNDNLEVVLESIEKRIRTFYKLSHNPESNYVERKVKENKYKAIEMIVYDCLFGNNDRHDENWAMRRNNSNIELYPLYDNERVLGLYENQDFIEKAINENNIEQASEEKLFSRMKIPGEKKEHSSYKNVLQYLIRQYPEETSIALEKCLKHNSPEIINTYLKSCEKLPECYIEFGTKMYKSRYDFAKELYINKKIPNQSYYTIEGDIR